MQTEYEATFLDIDKDSIRERLKTAGAKLEKPEVIMKRWIFDKKEWPRGKFLRVRDEWGKTVVTLKEFSGGEKDHPKEIEFTTENFDHTIEMFTALGCEPRSYQESMREVWSFDGAEVALDTWPFYEPFVEIEAATEADVERVSKALGFDWSKAIFASMNTLIQMKYGTHIHMRDIPRIAFDMQNPFV